MNRLFPHFKQVYQTSKPNRTFLKRKFGVKIFLVLIFMELLSLVIIGSLTVTELNIFTKVNTIFLAYAGAFIFTIIVSGKISTTISSSTTSLIEAAETISKGDLIIQLPANEKNELGVIAQALKVLAEQLSYTQETYDNQIQESTQPIEAAVQIGRQLSSILDVNELMELVIDRLQTSFRYEQVQIYLANQDYFQLFLVDKIGKLDTLRTDITNLQQGLIGQAMKSGSYILVQDTTKQKSNFRTQVLPDIRAEIAVPILMNDSVLGVLYASRTKPDSINRHDVELLRMISSQVAISLRNARFYDEMNEKLLHQATINHMIESIRATTTIDDAINFTAGEILNYTGGQLTKIHLRIDELDSDSNNSL